MFVFQFGGALPSRRHAFPDRPAVRIARVVDHAITFGGVVAEFLCLRHVAGLPMSETGQRGKPWGVQKVPDELGQSGLPIRPREGVWPIMPGTRTMCICLEPGIDWDYYPLITGRWVHAHRRRRPR